MRDDFLSCTQHANGYQILKERAMVGGRLHVMP